MTPARWIAIAVVAVLLGAGVWVAIGGDPHVPLSSSGEPGGLGPAGAISPPPRAAANRPAARADVDVIGEPAATPGRERTTVVHGRVLDAFDRPRSGARVWIDDGESIRRPSPLAATTSGPDGRFELLGAAPRGRSAWLSVRDPEHAAFDLAIDTDGPADVGELHLRRGGSVTGLIVTDGDLPIAGATVRLSTARAVALLHVRDRDAVLAPANTGIDGRFTFERVPVGTFRLEAFAARMLRERARDTLLVVNEATLDVGVLRLGTASVVRGSVTAADGTPIEAASVVVRSTSSGLGYRETVSTDANGAFEFGHVPTSTVQLEVTARGYVSWRRDDLDATRDRDVAVAMLAGLAIQGRVVDGATGAPIESFAVRPVRLGNARTDHANPLDDVARLGGGMEPRHANSPVDGRLRVPAGLASPTPHPDGAFTVDGLDEGVFAVEVRARDYLFARSEPVELRAAGATPAPIIVTLQRGARVAGRVVSMPGERAVAGARVTLTTPGFAGSTGRGPRSGATIDSTRSDARGEFAFDGVAHGNYRIAVRHGEFTEVRTESFDVSGDRDDLRIEARVSAQLFGIVAGLAPDEIERAKVVAFGGAGRMQFAPVGGDGSYELGPLVPGPHIVRAFVGEEHRFLAEEPELFRPRPPDEIVADVVLEPGDRRRHQLTVTHNPRGTLIGVVRENGTPVADARLRPGTLAQERTDTAGRYEIRDLPAGTIDIVVRLPDASQITLRSTVTIIAGTTSTWDAEFATGALRGSTVGTDLDDIDTTAILLPLDDDRRGHATSVTIPIRDGRFDASRLPAGPATLRVPIPGSTEVVEIDVNVPVGATSEVVVRRS